MTNNIKKLLVANRGEIAIRIMRTASILIVRAISGYTRGRFSQQHPFLQKQSKKFNSILERDLAIEFE